MPARRGPPYSVGHDRPASPASYRCRCQARVVSRAASSRASYSSIVEALTTWTLEKSSGLPLAGACSSNHVADQRTEARRARCRSGYRVIAGAAASSARSAAVSGRSGSPFAGRQWTVPSVHASRRRRILSIFMLASLGSSSVDAHERRPPLRAEVGLLVEERGRTRRRRTRRRRRARAPPSPGRRRDRPARRTRPGCARRGSGRRSPRRARRRSSRRRRAATRSTGRRSRASRRRRGRRGRPTSTSRRGSAAWVASSFL